MTEEAGVPREEVAEEAAPEPTAEPAAESPGVDSKDVDEGKVFAVLSYALSFIGVPFFLVPLIMRNNDFALYHAKQNLILWLAGIVVGIVTVVLSAVCIGLIVGPILGILLLVLAIMGLVNAGKGEAKPVPVIGKWGEDWFKGITKA